MTRQPVPATLHPMFTRRAKFVDARNHSDVREFLYGALTDELELLGTKTNRVTRAQIKVNHPVFDRNPFKSSQRRARFEYRGAEYDLPMTFEFDLPRLDEQARHSNSSWYFTISLGEPWEEQGGDCFKLVACALEAPS